MGYMRHHAILVTSWDEESIRRAHQAAEATGATVTGIVDSPMNGYGTFLVAPDGSKEDWPDSDQGDRAREELVRWLQAQAYEDGSTPFDWAEVQYGDEDGDNRVLQHDADRCRGEGK
jgi:hypothetical protein